MITASSQGLRCRVAGVCAKFHRVMEYREHEWLRWVPLGILVVAVLTFFGFNRTDDGDSIDPDGTAEVNDASGQTIARIESALEQAGLIQDETRTNVYVRLKGGAPEDWATQLNTVPGDRVEVLLRYENVGNMVANNVTVGVNLPKYVGYVNGSTELRSGSFPNSTLLSSDNIISGGIDVGNYSPDAVGYIKISAIVDPSTAFEHCGDYEVAFVGLAVSREADTVFNTAKLNIDTSEACQ